MNRDDYDIDGRLKHLSGTVLPSAPASIEQNVLRRIRKAVPGHPGWKPAFWPHWFTNPAFGLGLACISTAVGILSASMTGGERGPGAAPDPLVVFSDHAPGMLSPGLESNR